MGDGELGEELVAGGQEREQDAATIGGILDALDQPALLEAVDQLAGRVGTQHQTLGERAHRRGCPFGEALQGEEQLVLARLEADGARLLLGEGEEAAQLMAKLGERPAFGGT